MNTDKTGKIVAALVAGAGLSLSAAMTYTWIPGSTDWRSKASYRDDGGTTPVAQLPGGEDTVAFEGSQTVVIGDDDIEFVSSLKRLSPQSNSVTLEFNLSRDACLNAYVGNASASGYFGKLVKKIKAFTGLVLGRRSRTYGLGATLCRSCSTCTGAWYVARLATYT